MLLPPLFEYRVRENLRETTRKLCLRAAQQQAGAKPRHGRDDRKRERSFSGLRGYSD